MLGTCNLIIFVSLVFNVAYCWYNPVHRVKASSWNPYFGTFLDKILDPVDDDVKHKAELQEEEKPTIVGNILKQKIVSFKESVGKTLNSEKHKDEKNSPIEK